MLRLAWIVCARGECTRFGIRRPDSASTPRYAAGDLASPQCKPSYMKQSRTACTVPARTWCTTGGSLGILGAFYGVLCRQWRTNPIFAKREIWGQNISPPPLKGPKKAISASRSIHAPLAPLPDPESIAGHHATPRTRQRGLKRSRRADAPRGCSFTPGVVL